MSTFNKGIGRVQVQLRWDPSAKGQVDHDLDLVAATYFAADPTGEPAYLVHFDSRSPDGTIFLDHDNRTGKGLGADEIMTLEPGRLSTEYGRVVVGVAIQQRAAHITFADVANPGAKVIEGYTQLTDVDFTEVADATAATVGEFIRNRSGDWEFRRLVRGFDTDPQSFARTMGSRPGA
ncbi:TerD family protein [Actinacidiphila acididurans]|uniref:TerD family protein n=1 Tax=Actinacidiphila acididurans TaxID=2784346 RepID=A0ABS2U6L5_9ACTN|nr:TerD family protein [Actinacidiphila acididurans]MBM9510386.1 TerD family protein [Actinacidiphila acididurans]